MSVNRSFVPKRRRAATTAHLGSIPAHVRVRNPGEPEFQQVVTEVAAALTPLLESRS